MQVIQRFECNLITWHNIKANWHHHTTAIEAGKMMWLTATPGGKVACEMFAWRYKYHLYFENFEDLIEFKMTWE